MKLKKCLRYLVVLCIIFSLIPLSAHAKSVYIGSLEGTKIYWDKDSGTLTFSGRGEVPFLWDYYLNTDTDLDTAVKHIVVENGITKLKGIDFSDFLLLESVSLPSTVTVIDSLEFYECDKLKTVTLSEGLVGIRENAFSDCKALTTINIPNSVVTIERAAFNNCVSLSRISLPDSISSISNYTFSGCTGLQEITLPKGLTSIGTDAFDGCTGLQEITLPKGLTSIGTEAFKGCTGLQEITLPKGLTNIGDYAFSDCDGIKTITIPGSVRTIGAYAFYECDNLVCVVLEKGVQQIGNRAFNSCKKLRSISIPDGVTSIGDGAFYGCDKLKSVYLPSSVDTVGSYAFPPIYGGQINTFTDIYYAGTVAQFMDLGFSSYPKVHCQCTDPETHWTTQGNSSLQCSCGFTRFEGNLERPIFGHNIVDGKCKYCGTVVPRFERIYGENRFDTAFQVAEEMKQILGVSQFETIIVASGKDFADALSGSYLAAVKQAPILLGYKDAQNAQVQAYIRENLAPGGKVYILGGTSAVPASMEAGLAGLDVKRLAGDNRFSTNLEVLKEAGIPAGEEVLVCTGTDFADCLSAAATGKPILLTYKRMMAGQEEFLASLSGVRYCIIGGENAVNATVAGAIGAYGATERLAGAHRYETSVKVAQRFFGSPSKAVLAYARNFPDGLCGGALAAILKSPLILTDGKYYSYATEYSGQTGIHAGFVLGGNSLVSEAAAKAIFGS